jgi:hypothetical protein
VGRWLESWILERCEWEMEIGRWGAQNIKAFFWIGDIRLYMHLRGAGKIGGITPPVGRFSLGIERIPNFSPHY